MTNEDAQLIYSFHGYAHKLFGDTDNVKDILQDVCLRILNNPETFERLNTLEKRRYVIRAIHNKFIDRHRNATRKGRIKFHVRVEESQASTHPDVFGKMELKEVMKKGKGFRHFSTLMLQVHGYTSYEIADMTDTNLNTVLGRFRYARTFLNK